MPWQECNLMDERLKFVARLLDGEKMAKLCREFGISRKTGYKIYNRYKEAGRNIAAAVGLAKCSAAGRGKMRLSASYVIT